MVWTLDDVCTANTLEAEDWAWVQHQRNQHGPYITLRDCSPVLFLSWDWIIYVQRLCWTYGEDGALDRLNSRSMTTHHFAGEGSGAAQEAAPCSLHKSGRRERAA